MENINIINKNETIANLITDKIRMSSSLEQFYDESVYDENLWTSFNAEDLIEISMQALDPFQPLCIMYLNELGMYSIYYCAQQKLNRIIGHLYKNNVKYEMKPVEELNLVVLEFDNKNKK